MIPQDWKVSPQSRGWFKFAEVANLSEALVNNNLTVHIKLVIHSYATTDRNNLSVFHKTDALTRRARDDKMVEMQKNGVMTDVTLKSMDGQLFKAHKLVLAGTSEIYINK